MVPSIFKHWNMRGMWKGSDAANPGKYTVISGLTFEYINITHTHMRHTIQKVVSFYPWSQFHYLEVDMRMPCINVVVVSWRSKSPLGRLHPTPGDPSHILQRGEGAPRDPNWKSCSVTAVGSLGSLARSCILPVHLPRHPSVWWLRNNSLQNSSVRWVGLNPIQLAAKGPLTTLKYPTNHSYGVRVQCDTDTVQIILDHQLISSSPPPSLPPH